MHPFVVQPLEGGSTRFLSVLESKDAPEQYEYRFVGNDLHLQEDGSVAVRDGNLIVGVIDAPWATDSAGTPVLTRTQEVWYWSNRWNGPTLAENVIRDAAGKSFICIYGDPFGLIAVAGRVGNTILS